jgi:peptide/nickel transport system substrate-binding protein
VTIVLEERIENIDPHDHNGLSAYLLFKNIYDGLVDRDPSGKIVPALATEWRVIEPTVWEFKLRPGVTFSNGEPWNARAAKASIDRLVQTGNWGTKRQFGLWRNMDRGEVVDDSTVRVITKAPMGAILSNLSLGAMMPESIATKRMTDAITDQAEIVGTGPYKMTGWTPGQSVVVEANASYWGPTKPKVQRVTINTIVEAATRIAGLQAGDTDVSWALQPLQAVNQLKTNANLEVHSIDSLRIMWMAFGHKREPFTNPALREAAQRAVNFDIIARTVLVGEGKACQCLIAPGTFGAINDLDTAMMSYNPDRSKELLGAAGFAAGDGPAVRFIAPVGSPQPVLEAIVDQLNAVGFKSKLELMEVGDYINVRNNGECDIFANGFTAVTGDAEFILPTMFYCGTSRSGYCNPEVDKLLDQAAAETDQNKRLDLYRQASQIVWNDRADLWHYQMALHVGAKKGLSGLVVRPDNLLPLQDLEWQA